MAEIRRSKRVRKAFPPPDAWVGGGGAIDVFVGAFTGALAAHNHEELEPCGHRQRVAAGVECAREQGRVTAIVGAVNWLAHAPCSPLFPTRQIGGGCERRTEPRYAR